MDSDTDLIRINKYLAMCGLCSRREADRLILLNEVTIDGKVATAGDRVSFANTVKVNGKTVSLTKKVLLAYNKPVGIVCSTVNQGKENNNIIDAVNYGTRLFPIGRLDKDSEGLIFLTNDGALADEIMTSKKEHEKEYIVSVDINVTESFIKKMSSGVAIELEEKREPYITKKCKVKQISDKSFSIVLTEGKNRQIRRMCSALGANVTSLKRIRIMNYCLGDLKTGEYIEIDKKLLT